MRNAKVHFALPRFGNGRRAANQVDIAGYEFPNNYTLQRSPEFHTKSNSPANFLQQIDLVAAKVACLWTPKLHRRRWSIVDAHPD